MESRGKTQGITNLKLMSHSFEINGTKYCIGMIQPISSRKSQKNIGTDRVQKDLELTFSLTLSSKHTHTLTHTHSHTHTQFLKRKGAHSDSGQQSLGHVGHDDTDEEDDSLQPAVAQDDGEDEERDAQEDGHTSDDVDEVLNLLGDGCLACVQARGQRGNAAHHGAVTGTDHNTASST